MADQFTLSRITIYPIKSLDGVTRSSAEVLPTGALRHDRRWALHDAQGERLNGKANADIHLLRANFSDDLSEITVQSARDGRQASFRLDNGTAGLTDWLAEFFGQRVRITENTHFGFPDDTDSPGPTVASRQTFEGVANWFPSLPLENVRRRFRANLEIDGDAPFCEDRLVADARHVVRFTIGGIEFEGTTACQRCIVPTRDPFNAAIYPRFAKEFATHREAELPDWTVTERFDHFYRLSVNTRLSPRSAGGTINVGDEVRIVEVATA